MQSSRTKIFETLSSSVVRLPTEVFMDEIEAVVTKKYHFDNREESFFITIFLKFWTTKFLMQWSKQLFLNSNTPVRERRY